MVELEIETLACPPPPPGRLGVKGKKNVFGGWVGVRGFRGFRGHSLQARRVSRWLRLSRWRGLVPPWTFLLGCWIFTSFRAPTTRSEKPLANGDHAP